ncbi:heme peroxidase [Pholiota conissans]|uniref:Peroxidase n=1 Tax=Pholiota conissans TaxID=109636 RepID=A0A9P5YLT9_9AGAR|nr:heme peroxidase [Pholiota conissans]
MLPLRIGTLFAFASIKFAYGYHWPSPQYDALESFLWEGGDNRVGEVVSNLVDGCRNRAAAPGSSIAAEWLRFAYHDAATHNITDGTGGLDASIYYELDRPENIGDGQVQTSLDFRFTATKYVSRADIIALGAVWGVAACGGPVIKYKGGRKDAVGPRAPGVPEPNQDLATHVEKFRLQGFNATEMIQLVACGHSFGGVRSVDFPDVVKPNASAPGGIGLARFDTTEKYDPAVVTEFLDGTTQNPLVVSNVTLASDLRIFSSDGNATMKNMATASSFADTCSSMLERMINTVPSDTQLTDEIQLLPVKVRDAQITVINSQLVFMTSLRLSRPADKPVPSGREVTLYWCDGRGSSQNCAGNIASVASTPSSKVITPSPIGGPSNIALDSYEFAVPLSANQSLSKFWFVLDDKDGSVPITLDNEGTGYVFPQDEIIFISDLGSIRAGGTGDSSRKFNFVVGIRSKIDVANATMLGYTSDDYPVALNFTVPLQVNKTATPVDGYSYYTGSITIQGNSLMLDFEVNAKDKMVYRADYIRGDLVGPETFFVPPISPVTMTTLSAIPTMLTSASTTPTRTPPPKDTSSAVAFVIAPRLTFAAVVLGFTTALSVL